tara:strand:+ start:231 stop:713 length:483 start_codon:yes stop_codon:yes gene_type:complete
MASDREIQAMADRQAALNGIELSMSEYAVKNRNPSMYDNGNTVTDISQKDLTDKQKAATLDKLIRDKESYEKTIAAENQGFLAGVEQGYAKQVQEVPTPSYGSSIKNAISKLFSGRGSNEEGLSHTFANDNVRSIAASEEAKFNAQQNIPAQEADRLRNY